MIFVEKLSKLFREKYLGYVKLSKVVLSQKNAHFSNSNLVICDKISCDICSKKSFPNYHFSKFKNKLSLSYRSFHSSLVLLESSEEFDILLEENSENDIDSPLFLTKYLDRGLVDHGQECSHVKGLELSNTILSYSGFFTVNKKLNSNLFFWFFPAKINSEEAPVILWLNGGPGASSMFGLFAGHGPILVDSNSHLQPRDLPWTLNHSVIYIDSPVGTGFSFTNNEEGYARNIESVISDLYNALLQFFKLFPNFRQRDFYIAGQSYAGKYAPLLSIKIHNENNRLQNDCNRFINLKGLAIGSGLCDPLTQMNYGNYLYNIGLIDEHEKNVFDKSYIRLTELIQNQSWSEAHRELQYLIIGWPKPIVSRFEFATGFSDNSNYLNEDMPERYAYYINYLNQERVKRAIHVGNCAQFGKQRNKVYLLLCDDFGKSVKGVVEELLNLEYKILFYASQLDIIVPHTGISSFIQSLNWKHSNSYLKESRKVWKVNSQLAGYVKETRNLTHLLIRNAGHVAPHDQPQRCFDMISRFTRNQLFSSD